MSVSNRGLPLLLFVVLMCAGGGACGSPPAGVSDLPLVELPVQSDSPDLVILLSGDGGWVGLVRVVSGVLNQSGISVVDFATSTLLLLVLKAPMAQFRTAWFVESVVSAALVVLAIRTRGTRSEVRERRW